MTRLFAVIGDPVTHSLSPVMHTAAFRAWRMDALYAPFEVPRPMLGPILRGLSAAGVEGCGTRTLATPSSGASWALLETCASATIQNPAASAMTPTSASSRSSWVGSLNANARADGHAGT